MRITEGIDEGEHLPPNCYNRWKKQTAATGKAVVEQKQHRQKLPANPLHQFTAFPRREILAAVIAELRNGTLPIEGHLAGFITTGDIDVKEIVSEGKNR